jgi:DNA mismatch repair protein MutS2
MILLDELCSGTNPTEGEEVFVLVLQLLERLHPTAFVTTHYLEFARNVEDSPPVMNMQFLRVEMDDLQESTYQFVPGVAATSLASVMAERMGVTLERLTRIIAKRNG